MKVPNTQNNEEKKKLRAIPPFECVENGCKERSKKCFDCRYFHCTWFYVPINDKKEH